MEIKEVGNCEGVRVFTDSYVGKLWVNIEKGGRILKLRPALVEPLIELLRKAKEKVK